MTARVRTALIPLLAAALGACGNAAAPAFTADPHHYLLTLDELASPDFTAEAAFTPPPTPSQAAAATAAFTRAVDFATSNGPIEVIDTVERFASGEAAHASFATDIARLDAAQGAIPTSTGSLGDEAHADSLVRLAPDGLQAVQVVLEWRSVNIVVVLTVRGRYGGTRLDDALALAHRQMSKQLSG